ncbi:MAG: hypothetical protein AAGF73_12165 [Actinomycetota bacterium]
MTGLGGATELDAAETATRPARPTTSTQRTLIVIGGCAAIAALSLLLPGTLSYDPTGWIVWGRQVGRLELDTVSGPSWKPLPVMVTTLAGPFGAAAPELWMWVARTAGLLAVVGVVRLGASLAGPVAGALAGALLILTPDAAPRFIRTWAEGHDAPATAALAVWAIERHLSGRPRVAYALVVALALLRPEAWPFLLVYAGWLGMTTDVSRTVLTLSLVAIPVLWFGGDLWGAGNALQGATAAQVIPLDLTERTTTALGNVGAMVIVPAWLAAGVAVVIGVRRRDLVPLAVAALAVAWCAVVSAMAIIFGYAALSRFLLPAAALVCVLAGAGVVQAVRLMSQQRSRIALVAAIVAVSAPFIVVRATGLPNVWNEVRFHDDLGRDLVATIELVGFDPETSSCTTVAVEPRSQLQPATAWELDTPLRDVRFTPESGDVFFLVVVGSEAEAALIADPTVEAVGGTGTIAAYSRNCA